MQLDLKKAFKVESFEKENGQIIITYTIPELPEILDSMNVSGKASVDFSKFESAEGVTMNVDTGQTFSFTDEIFDQSGTLTTEQKINLEGNVDLGKNREILYELSLGIEDIKYKFDVDFNSIFDDGPTVLVRDAFVKMKAQVHAESSFGKEFDANDYGLILLNDEDQILKKFHLVEYLLWGGRFRNHRRN